MGIYTDKAAKIVSLKELVSFINDGDTIAIGGKLSAREPMGIIHEMIRQKKRNLRSVGGAHGMDIDILCASKVLDRVQHSYVGFEADFGLAPNYRRLAKSGDISIKETDCVAMTMQLKAAKYGIPFIPTPLVAGTDILRFNEEFLPFSCPFSGEKVNLVPAIRPDVAIIHAHKADTIGNIRIEPPVFADGLLSEASKKLIVSVEEIISEDEMKQLGATIPYYEVTAITELPYGAHPTSCYPNYSYDRAHLAEYISFAQEGEESFYNNYLKPYVLDVDSHAEYVKLVGGAEKIEQLGAWSENVECWMEILQRDSVVS